MMSLPAPINRHTEQPVDLPAYSWGWIVALSLLPGLARIGARGLLGPLHEYGYELVWMFYFGAEALILVGFMWVIGRREGNVSLKSLVPYQQHVGLLLFLSLLVISTAIAIFFRDFFQSELLNGLASAVRSKIDWWPPSWATFPDNNALGDSLGGWKLSLFALAGTLTIVAASGMQTLYFRGFILPRMPQIGWWTMAINCVLFSVYHLSSPWFWAHFLVYTFIWGVVTYMTRNVWIAVISHMIFNSYMVILSAMNFS